MNNREKIIEIVANNCDMDNVSEYLQSNDDLSKIGMNSVKFIKLLVDFEDDFNIEFDSDELDYSKFNSFNTLCDFIESKINK